jgi:HAD superfamily hydrolase (TIGR01509 family)
MIRALLWDVDGTLAETEREGHLVAFNRAFAEAGLDWHWDDARYAALLRVTGGRERLLADMATRADAPSGTGARETLARALHERKNRAYAALVDEGRVALREGVAGLLDECRSRGVRLAIVTTTSRANVEALLRATCGARGPATFDVRVCGEDVRAKKPDPEAYLRALAALGLSPLETVALEDSPGGAAAARAAEVPVVVTRSHYFAHDAVDGAIAIGPGLHTRAGWRPGPSASPAREAEGPVTLDDLEAWHSLADCVSSCD